MSMMDMISKLGLADKIIFSYNSFTKCIDVSSPIIDPDIKKRQKEIETIINLMTRNGIKITEDIEKKEFEIQQLIKTDRNVHEFAYWLKQSLTSLNKKEVLIAEVNYSPDKGCKLAKVRH